jgi:hypothetical protein
MVVRSADEDDFLPHMPQAADIKVCGHVCPQVPDVTGAVGIGEAAGHEDGLFSHHYAFDGDAINN